MLLTYFVLLLYLQRIKDQETHRRQTGRDLQSFKERQHELDLLQMKVRCMQHYIVDVYKFKRNYLKY